MSISLAKKSIASASEAEGEQKKLMDVITTHEHAGYFKDTLSLPCGEQKRQNRACVKYWETIADKLSKAGWSLGWVSALDSEGRTLWIVDAHRDNGKRFIVTADGKLRAFLELQRVTRESFRFPNVE